MANRSLCEDEIYDQLDECTMEDAFDFFKSLSGGPVRVLEEKVRMKFPNLCKGVGILAKKVKGFQVKYENQLKAIQNKMKRKIQKSGYQAYYIKGEPSDTSEERGYRFAGSLSVSHFNCTKCAFVGHTPETMKKHAHKSHVVPELKREAERSEEWLKYRRAPFNIDGKVSTGPDERETRDERDAQIQDLENEIRELRERNEELQTAATTVSETPVIPVAEATPVIKIHRQSSITDSGFHGVKYTPSPNVPGGMKATPVTLVDVTTRQGRQQEPNVFGETPKISRNRKKVISNKLNDTLSELSRNLNREDSSRVLAATIDKQDKENIPLIHTFSKKIGETHQFSPVEAAELQIDNNLSVNQIRKLKSGAVKKGIKIFPSVDKITAAKRSLTGHLDKDDYTIKNVQLQIKRQGDDKHHTEIRPVVQVILPHCIINYLTFLLNFR